MRFLSTYVFIAQFIHIQTFLWEFCSPHRFPNTCRQMRLLDYLGLFFYIIFLYRFLLIVWILSLFVSWLLILVCIDIERSKFCRKLWVRILIVLSVDLLKWFLIWGRCCWVSHWVSVWVALDRIILLKILHSKVWVSEGVNWLLHFKFIKLY